MKQSLCSTFGLIVLGTGTGAYAQQANPEPTTAQQPGGASSSDLHELEVIVTGTRSAKAVDKIPGAITVITPAEVQRELTLTEEERETLQRWARRPRHEEPLRGARRRIGKGHRRHDRTTRCR